MQGLPSSILGDFQNNRQNALENLPQDNPQGHFAHPLDDPEEWPAFGRQSAQLGPAVWDSQIALQGMYCATCALTIEEAIARIEGVQRVEVSAAAERARVVWDAARTRPSVWFAAVEAAGYRAHPAHDIDARQHRQLQSRRALWRWLLAAFCMMQVMMYAWPSYEYTVGGGDLSWEMETLLRWAAWVISVPMLIFSCGPFFKAAWRDVRTRRVSMDLPVALGLGVTFVVSTLGTLNPSGVFGREVFFDSLTMFAAFLLAGRWLEMRLRERTAGALEAVLNRLPASVEREGEGGAYERVALRRVAVGDVLRVRAGEAFPADGVLLDGATQADEALLSGESRPVPKTAGATLAAGSFNLGASVRMRVTQLGEHTRFGQILTLMEGAATQKPRLAELADRAAGPFLVAILLLAAASAAYWWDAVGAGPALMVAATVLIVTCPCALSLATPVAMLTAAGTLARTGVLTRRLQALEALAAVNTVVFDKTGTLTHAALQVTQSQWLHAGAEFAQELSLKSAKNGQNEPILLNSVLNPEQTKAYFGPRLGADAAAAQASAPHPWQGAAAAVALHSVHPASRAVAASDAQHAARWTVLAVREVAARGLVAQVAAKAKPEQIWQMRLGSRHFVLGENLENTKKNSEDNPFIEKTIYFGLENSECLTDFDNPENTPPNARDAILLAQFTLREGLRGEAAEVVAHMQKMGIAVHLLSGDVPAAVARAAQQCGIAPDRVRAQCSPEGKMQAVVEMQSAGRTVAMVGDGLNDGPVLAGADVSFAFGAAVPLACAQSDFVVPGSDLRQIVQAIALARRTMAVVRQNLIWAAAYNAASVPFAAAGLVPAWLAGLGMAASSLLVVLNAARLARTAS